MDKPLKGIKVLDLTTFVAAPCCTRLLADLGADVIKVERGEGDAWRHTGVGYCPDHFSHQMNPVFDLYNTGKKHIVLNLKTKEGLEIFHKLLQQSDIFVTNTRSDALKRLGVFYDDLKEKYPRLIYAMISGFGEKGPDAPYRAFDNTAFWSRSGFLRDLAVPTENGEYAPVYPPASMGDTISAYLLLAEINAALYNRQRTGKGDFVISSLYHNGIFVMGTMAVTTQRPWGKVYPRERIDHCCPGGYYRCKDGEYLFISAGFQAKLVFLMFEALGKPELIDDPRFSTPAAVAQNKEALHKIFTEEFMTKTSDEWLKITRDLDLSAEKLRHFADVSEDEQAWANGYLQKVTFANGQEGVIPSSPIEMESLGELKTTPAHSVGEDTDEVLRSLGYTDAELESLKEKGVTKVTFDPVMKFQKRG